jgi:hypothetical protein
MAALHPLYKSTPIANFRPKTKVVRPPAYSCKEICTRYGLTMPQLKGYLSEYHLPCQMNVSASRPRGVYSLTDVDVWAKAAGLTRVV